MRGSQSQDELERLIEQLGSDSLDERRVAEDRLVAAGVGVISPLLNRLREAGRSDISWYLARVLSRIGEPSIDPLLGFIRSDANREAKMYAAAALAEMTHPPVKRLIDMLGDPDPTIRGCASLILSRIGSRAVEGLKKALEETEGMHRRCVEMTLLRIYAGGRGAPDERQGG